MSLDLRNTHFRSNAYIAFKLGKDAINVHQELVEVFGLDRTPNLRTIYVWFEGMRNAEFTLEKGTRPRYFRIPSTTEPVQKTINNDPRMSIRDLWCRSDVPTTTVYRILTEELKRQSVCFVCFNCFNREKQTGSS